MSESFSVCNKLGILIKAKARNSLKQSKKYKPKKCSGLNNVNMVRKLIFFLSCKLHKYIVINSCILRVSTFLYVYILVTARGILFIWYIQENNIIFTNNFTINIAVFRYVFFFCLVNIFSSSSLPVDLFQIT